MITNYCHDCCQALKPERKGAELWNPQPQVWSPGTLEPAVGFAKLGQCLVSLSLSSSHREKRKRRCPVNTSSSMEPTRSRLQLQFAILMARCSADGCDLPGQRAPAGSGGASLDKLDDFGTWLRIAQTLDVWSENYTWNMVAVVPGPLFGPKHPYR